MVEMDTASDQDGWSISKKSLGVQSIDFTGSLDQDLLNNEIDAAVHSLKDVPQFSCWNNGEETLKIAACLAREDPSDVIVSSLSSDDKF